jgi:hypothetical protein
VEKCQGHAHPSPTTEERAEMHAKLYDAIQAIDKAWGYANRTPSLHDMTDRIGHIMADIIDTKRTV